MTNRFRSLVRPGAAAALVALVTASTSIPGHASFAIATAEKSRANLPFFATTVLATGDRHVERLALARSGYGRDCIHGWD